jgi:hypothetical protein
LLLRCCLISDAFYVGTSLVFYGETRSSSPYLNGTALNPFKGEQSKATRRQQRRANKERPSIQRAVLCKYPARQIDHRRISHQRASDDESLPFFRDEMAGRSTLTFCQSQLLE